MAKFQKGNKLWQFRNKHGRDYKYTPEKLWEEALLYFDWVEQNPLKEQKVFCYQGEIVTHDAEKMRAMTLGGFQLFADIDHVTWSNYKNNPDFFTVTKKIDESIREQKFTGASADLLNANIIARDLGLRDKQEIDQTVKIKKVKIGFGTRSD